jgi:FAD/FMN-containing dehydrogenase/Fe-S oxidoreductase
MPLILPDKKHAIAVDLRRMLSDEQVKDDGPSLTAYAVDASMYRISPQAVVLVESEADIEAVITYAVGHGIPVTPRAAGTNLTGSAIGNGIILDVSRMNRVLEVNPEEKWVRVQTGVVYAELNRRLLPSGLLFGPDPSSGDMCKLGGMLANNSSGPHTLRYGSVKDNVRALRVCLETSGWLEARPYALDDPRVNHIRSAHPAVASALDLIQSHSGLIREKRPRVTKNSAGYNVFGLVDGFDRQMVDLPQLFVGSEGTLGVISEATLNLVERPKASATLLIHFRHLDEVGEAVVALLTLSPSALEVMDRNTLDLIGRSKHGIPADSTALLLVELDADSADGIANQAAQATGICRRYRLAADPIVAFERAQRDALWGARKALYPTLYRYDQRRRPINFVDDVVVPAERLGDLIRYLEEHFGGQRTPVAIFGHIGNGNAHILPLLDLNDHDDFERMVESYQVVHDTVLTRFGGSICGEHGDGRVRAGFVRRMFGEELYGLFVRIKQGLDPAGVLNPGVKISEVPFTEHIDYTRLSKSCATCAKCNSVCPVYDVFQSEDMSSRGWYEIVTAKDYSYLDSQRVVEACLNCKSCRTICPAGVDVADLILKRRAEHPNRAAGWIFAVHARPWLFEPMLKLVARFQWLWDRPAIRTLIEWSTRPIMKRIASTARIPRDMALPRLAKRTLRDRYAELARMPRSGRRPVAYFHGCAANYLEDGVGDAVIELLREQGMEPDLPPQRCSGTPIETYGHRNLVMEGARSNMASLAPYDVVVTGCASCTLMLKDYPSLFEPGVERDQAEQLAARVRHISEVLDESGGEGGSRSKSMPAAASPPSLKVTYHSSCHLRAAGVTKAPRQVLQALPGRTYVEMQDADRCAGGAGTYILKDYDTAQKIFARKRRAIEESGAHIVATSCPACMIQLKNGLRDKVEVKHVAQAILDARRSHVSDQA